ncbi:putative DNA modification/repair radical SAM protein [Sinanaerobacter sp. ZZT-01]|uniref:putative DNA modification/repair radical SAM protein n=1 Tax=Sinanaerobacter sp. ZZT-01 TaxID=3111540 RepID=UPI002D78F90E|nr:putative DNA modification/repair radical SAM protein [Sinanaerobacter sp. ZZT-01]WRR94826.1 putative DNA modification/repair radical SAM protein [Sinanaerobacter sp. ZZT-01]
MPGLDVMLEKLKILADSAKYDVSCSSSGADRTKTNKMGTAAVSGICHSWSADGRCISLLKILFSNRCVYDCEYCVNRRSADVQRASFEPEELAKLTIEFYKRNYIEGLFLSSAVEVSPDYTAERILKALSLLREKYGFSGYIHAKIIPGVSAELVRQIGMQADRLSVNIELPTKESLAILAPQKKAAGILTPMRQITNTMKEQKSLKGAGNRFSKLKQGNDYLLNGMALPTAVREQEAKYGMVPYDKGSLHRFAPAGQTTQMIIGATPESDRQIIRMSESLYKKFQMKRVYFSAYIPVVSSSKLPALLTPPPLLREHRLYQADWLLRFYGFSAEELLDEDSPFFDLELDPKVTWALRHLELFPLEINKVSMEELLRIPGVGNISAMRIVRQRRLGAVTFDDLKKIGVVVKRARYFITCNGKYYGAGDIASECIRERMLSQEKIRSGLLPREKEEQLSLFGSERRNLLYEPKEAARGLLV